MPIKWFWGKIVNLLCYLINKSPHASLEGNVVDKIWTCNPINLENLRIFWCLSFGHICSEDRYKLDLKTKKCVFVIYVKGVKWSSYGIQL